MIKNFGFYAFLLKIAPVFFKIATLGKVALIGGSVVAYSYLFTWQFALALVAMLFVHEYGHVWCMKRYGMKVKGMYFIPFIGAVAVPEENFPSRESEGFSALAGPAFGAAFVLVSLGIYAITGNTLFGAVAGLSALINLFNMFPIMPLDGGRITRSILFSFKDKSWHILGLVIFAIGIILSAVSGLYLLTTFGIIGFIEAFFDVRNLWKYGPTESIPSMSTIYVVRLILATILVGGFFVGTIYGITHIPEVELSMKVLQNKSL